MPRRYRCKKCGGEHSPPTGKRCPHADTLILPMPSTSAGAEPQQDDTPVQPTPSTSARDISSDEEEEAEQSPEVGNGQLLTMMMEIRTEMSSFRQRMDGWEARGTGADNQSDPESLPDSNDQIVQPQDNAGLHDLTPESLRKNMEIMAQAAERLAQFGASQVAASGGLDNLSIRGPGKKSGSQLLASDAIKAVIDWPHFYVMRLTAGRRKPVHYCDLRAVEFMQGYLAMLKAPKSVFDRETMLELLHTLMQDATDYGWENAREFYEMLGIDVEWGLLRWNESVTIENRRLTYCRAVAAEKKEVAKEGQKAQTRSAPPGTRCCASYQRNACDQQRDHHPFTHACNYCFRTCTALYRHAEDNCFRKINDEAKNAKGRE